MRMHHMLVGLFITTTFFFFIKQEKQKYKKKIYSLCVDKEPIQIHRAIEIT